MEERYPLGILTEQPMLAECLERELGRHERFIVAGYDSMDACRRACKLRGLSLLIVDVSQAWEEMHALLKEVKTLSLPLMLLGLDPSAEQGCRFLDLEADASLPLETTLEALVEAIDKVLAGEKIYPPSVAFMLYQRLAQKAEERELRQRLAALALTRRELEILSLLADHCSNKSIAHQLDISIHTVKNHVHSILEKLQVDNRESAAELAQEQGWISASRATERPPSHLGF